VRACVCACVAYGWMYFEERKMGKRGEGVWGVSWIEHLKDEVIRRGRRDGPWGYGLSEWRVMCERLGKRRRRGSNLLGRVWEEKEENEEGEKL
jgi:hypothetical protein